MVDLRILWVNVGEELRIFTQEQTLRKSLENLGVEVIYHENTPQTADLTELDRIYQPDVINLINISWMKNTGGKRAVATIITGDPHGKDCVDFINGHKIEASLHPYRGILPDGNLTYGMEYKYRGRVHDEHKLIFFPWWVDDETFKPLEKDIDVFYAGEFKSYYPLRTHIWHEFLTNPVYEEDFKIVYRHRPRRTRNIGRNAPSGLYEKIMQKC